MIEFKYFTSSDKKGTNLGLSELDLKPSTTSHKKNSLMLKNPRTLEKGEAAYSKSSLKKP